MIPNVLFNAIQINPSERVLMIRCRYFLTPGSMRQAECEAKIDKNENLGRRQS